jgi:glutamate-ammonia-ligase adenylyltransferase
MIDELLDSLVLDQPRTLSELKAELAELCRGASDLDPILHSFQDKELVRIGVRDLLGKEPVQATTAALSDLAETVLVAAFDHCEPASREKFGTPVLAEELPCRSAVIGLGKLGGREIGYHSDLDLIVVYEADGPIVRPADLLPGARSSTATNARFFTDLAQRVIKVLSQPGPFGRLYEVDMRLRPTGKSGSLVVSLAEFRKYFSPGGGAQLWERQALTRARVVRADPGFAEIVTATLRSAALGLGWSAKVADDIAAMRKKLEAGTTTRNLKRGIGGLVDVEFAVQLLQLKYGLAQPDLCQPNIWAALDALEARGILPAMEAATLRTGYTFLRTVESRLRFLTDRSLTELPESADDREKLARRLGMTSALGLREQLATRTQAIRRVFQAILQRERD